MSVQPDQMIVTQPDTKHLGQIVRALKKIGWKLMESWYEAGERTYVYFARLEKQ